jgi:predicted dehydrogenase
MKRVAIVGFGFMGMTHAINVLKHPDLELVAIVDKNPAAVVDKLSAKSGNIQLEDIDFERFETVKSYTTIDDCLEYEELDAIFVCVHTDLHYEICRKALLHNKHVFLEKPFCLDTQQADSLIKLAKEKEKILMVGQVVRFMPPYQKLKSILDSGKYGELKFLSLSRYSGIPAWGEWPERRAPYGSSGGALFDLILHDIDFANYILGMPGSIKCDYLPGLLSKHDYISAIWSYYGKNLTVRVEGGNIFHSAFPFQAGFIALFEQASVQYSTTTGDLLQISRDAETETETVGSAGNGFYNELAYFALCIMQNRPPLECTPESSLQAIQLCYDHL